MKPPVDRFTCGICCDSPQHASLPLYLLAVLTWCVLPTDVVSLTGIEAQQVDSQDLAESASGAGSELAELEQMAQESFTQDDLETAVALYRQLAARHEATAEKVRVMTTIAWLEHERGRAEPARQTLTEVLVLDPDYSFQPELYSDAFASLFYDAQKRALEEREAKASRLVRLGTEHLRARRFDEARSDFQEALSTWSEQPKAIYNLALVDYYEDNNDEALAGFQKLLALAAARPELVGKSLQGLALTNLGLLYLSQNQDEEAARALEKAVGLSPANATAWSNLALTRRQLGDVGGAADAARKSLELAADDVGAHRSLAIALLDANQPAEAAQMLRESTRRFPEDAGLWLYAGLAARRLARTDEAESALRRAIDRDSANTNGWAAPAALQLAALSYERNDDRETLRLAQQAVAWRPDDAGGHVYLGLAKAGLGDLEGARVGLEQARRLDPVQAETHNNLGSVYYELGRLRDAEEAFKRALAIVPGHPEARRNLEAVASARRGEKVSTAPSIRRPAQQAPPRTTPPSQPPPRRTTPTRNQSPPSANLGWVFSDVDYASLGLQGVMVDRVVAGSAAERAGLQGNDLLLKVDGQPISGGADLDRYVRSRDPGSEVILELLRDNRPIKVSLVRPR